MNPSQVLTAIGLTVWLGVLLAVAVYVSLRMRFPKSLFAPDVPLATRVMGSLVGLVFYGYYAFTSANVVVIFDIFMSGLIPYVLAVYAISVTIERRRAQRLGLPEPGTGGTLSMAEGPVFFAVALPFAAVAVFLTVYGMANEISGNSGEGIAGLGLGAVAWFIAIGMGLFGFGVLWLRRLANRS